jgi:hypothetical protein
MARRRVWRANTTARYLGKLRKSLEARLPEDQAKAVAESSSNEYSARFGVYRDLYAELIKEFGDRIPRTLLGAYRSALFAMYKFARKGYPVEMVIEKFANPREGGLDRALLEDIARYFGLLEASAEKTAGA